MNNSNHRRLIEGWILMKVFLEKSMNPPWEKYEVIANYLLFNNFLNWSRLLIPLNCLLSAWKRSTQRYGELKTFSFLNELSFSHHFSQSSIISRHRKLHSSIFTPNDQQIGNASAVVRSWTRIKSTIDKQKNDCRLYLFAFIGVCHPLI